MCKTDDEVKKLAGHPDAIPVQYIEWFLRGWRACETNGESLSLSSILLSRRCEYCGVPDGIHRADCLFFARIS